MEYPYIKMIPIQLLLLFNFLLPKPADTLHLAADLQRDKQLFYQDHGASIDNRSKQDYQLFEQYAKLSRVGFSYSRSKKGNHVIKKWYSAAKKLGIYQVESAVHVDSTVRFIQIDPDSTDKQNDQYHVKATFHYRTYIIKDGSNPLLIYQTERKGRLCEYRIGKMVVSPTYEDVIMGQVYPDMEQILRIINNKE